MQNLVTVTCRRDLNHMLLQVESLKHLTEPINHYVIIDDSSLEPWTTLLAPYYTTHTNIYKYTMQNLVTVTCRRDLNHMLLQAESLKHLTEPINHYVIIDDSSLEPWTTLLAPYYTTHKLHLILGTELYTKPSDNWFARGWRRQQVYKLLAYTVIKDSYLILDSQNFFLRSCTLKPWDNVYGVGFYNTEFDSVQVVDPVTAHSLKTYSMHLEVPICYRVRADGVPFVIDKIVMDCYDINSVVDDFISFDCIPFEFIYYNLLAYNVNYHGITLEESMYAPVREVHEQFPNLYWSEPACYIGGIHRTFLSYRNRKIVNTWLRSWGYACKL